MSTSGIRTSLAIACLALCAAPRPAHAVDGAAEVAALRAEVQQLRQEVGDLRQRLEQMTQQFGVARPTDARQEALRKAIEAGDAAAIRAMVGTVNPNVELAGGKRPVQLAIDGGNADVFAAILALDANGGNPRLKASDGRSLAQYLLAKGTPEMIAAARTKRNWTDELPQQSPTGDAR